MSASKVLFLSGILHIIIGIVALRLQFSQAIELLVTGFIFATLVFIWSLQMLKLSEPELALERSLIISSTTVPFLNILTYLVLMIWGAAQGQLYINILMGIVIIMDIFCFTIFYTVKIRYESMDTLNKLNYLTIIMIRGLGLGLLLYILAYVGVLTDEPNYVMIVYNSIFGGALIYYGEKLSKKKESKKIHMGTLFVVICAFLFKIILLFVYPYPKFIIHLTLLIIILVVQLAYLTTQFV